VGGTTVGTRTTSPGVTGGVVTWLTGNPQGSPQYAITASTGKPSGRQRYLPYGALNGGRTVTVTGRAFLGQPLDDSTGLIADGARYYNPVTGQFISPDPIIDTADPGTLNAYAYADGNPATWTDPTGLITGGITAPGGQICTPEVLAAGDCGHTSGGGGGGGSNPGPLTGSGCNPYVENCDGGASGDASTSAGNPGQGSGQAATACPPDCGSPNSYAAGLPSNLQAAYRANLQAEPVVGGAATEFEWHDLWEACLGQDPTCWNTACAMYSQLQTANQATYEKSEISLRLPDYVSFSAGGSLAALGVPFLPPFVTGGIGFTWTRQGHVFVAPSVGLGVPGSTGSIRAGYLDQSHIPTSTEVNNFVSKTSVTVSGYVPLFGVAGPDLAETWGDPGYATEYGVGVGVGEDLNISYSYSVELPWRVVGW
jgi:RHS repeat-associated protein